MAVEIVFETHSLTVDNERGVATGWLPGELSEEGRRLARELGERRRDDGIACVFTSDLRRAVETAEIAFAGSGIEVREDERLRECNYGELNGAPVEQLEPRARFIKEPFPGGESYRDCVQRTRRFLADVDREFDGRRVLVIGHSAQQWALRNLLQGVPLIELVDAPFRWQEGWEYVAPAPWSRAVQATSILSAVVSPLATFATIAGLLAAIAGWRPGAFIAIAAIAAQLICTIPLGVVGYRLVMSRPWPKVRPLEDDDW